MKITLSRRHLPLYFPVKGGGNIQLYEYNESMNEMDETMNEEGVKTPIIIRRAYYTFIIPYLDSYFIDVEVEVGEVEGEKQYQKWIDIDENYNDLLTKVKSGEIEQI